MIISLFLGGDDLRINPRRLVSAAAATPPRELRAVTRTHPHVHVCVKENVANTILLCFDGHKCGSCILFRPRFCTADTILPPTRDSTSSLGIRLAVASLTIQLAQEVRDTPVVQMRVKALSPITEHEDCRTLHPRITSQVFEMASPSGCGDTRIWHRCGVSAFIAGILSSLIISTHRAHRSLLAAGTTSRLLYVRSRVLHAYLGFTRRSRTWLIVITLVILEDWDRHQWRNVCLCRRSQPRKDIRPRTIHLGVYGYLHGCCSDRDVYSDDVSHVYHEPCFLPDHLPSHRMPEAGYPPGRRSTSAREYSTPGTAVFALLRSHMFSHQPLQCSRAWTSPPSTRTTP
jgi:hypothetical protein